jgi:hypothetical protein
MGQEATIHCAAKRRLLSHHRFIVAPLDMEARAKGEGGGTGFARAGAGTGVVGGGKLLACSIHSHRI